MPHLKNGGIEIISQRRLKLSFLSRQRNILISVLVRLEL